MCGTIKTVLFGCLVVFPLVSKNILNPFFIITKFKINQQIDGSYGDMWKLEINHQVKWTWVNGPSELDEIGVYAPENSTGNNLKVYCAH